MRSLPDGSIGLLALGLMAAATGAAASGYAVLHVGLALTAPRTSGLRKGVIFEVLAGFSEVGLVWLAVVFAVDGRPGPAWLAGGVALVVLVFWTGLVIRDSRMEDHELAVVVVGVALSGAAFGWLFVRLAADDQPLVAGLIAGPATLGLITLTYRLCGADDLDGWPGWGLTLLFTAGLGAAAAKLAVDGHSVAAGLVGGLWLIGILVGLWMLDSWPDLTWSRGLRRSGPEPIGPPPGGMVPLWARAAGLVVPLGSVVWAVLDSAGRPGTGFADVLVGVAELAIAVAVLLMLQGLVLGWLRPGCVPRLVEAAAHYVRRREPARHAPYRDSEWSERERYLREHERYLRERELDAQSPHDGEREALHRERARFEQERSWRDQEQIRVEFDRYRPAARATGILSRLVRPFSPAAGNEAAVEAALTTGLVVDRVWPRIELVASLEVKREAHRRSRDVALLRVTAASAVCTGLSWVFAAGVVARSQPGGGGLAMLFIGPFLIALAALALGRRRIVEAYEHRVSAVEVYRFDLAEAVRLPPPGSNAELITLSDVLEGHGGYDRPLVWSGAAETAAAVEVSAVSRESLVSEVSERVLREVCEVLRDEHEALAQRLTPGRLGKKDLGRLAQEVAQHTSKSVGERLGRQVADLQESSVQELRQALREGIEESVIGPPLANFTGYFALQLDTGHGHAADGAADTRPTGGAAYGTAVVASPGQRFGLVLFVVRDPRARGAASTQQTAPDRQFFALEPVHVEGGRDVPTVDFEAMVDSPTLTPSPQRQTLRTQKEAQTVFRFQMPDEEGRHEVWFQLYQSGRLLQVIAVSIAVRAAAPADIGEVSG
ncbi:hypothetical protein SLUN_01115 [Streptomyces lunaelactis]|uniref:Uncharacterized protein n=2 Tax=Streptomyces lunaelactis TaxID=1535768 RepID=A0A2R4SW26_9ACTN|nr:hypothetical protein SLUN_01115 [Streptomyces lunaelactis]